MTNNKPNPREVALDMLSHVLERAQRPARPSHVLPCLPPGLLQSTRHNTSTGGLTGFVYSDSTKDAKAEAKAITDALADGGKLDAVDSVIATHVMQVSLCSTTGDFVFPLGSVPMGPQPSKELPIAKIIDDHLMYVWEGVAEGLAGSGLGGWGLLLRS